MTTLAIIGGGIAGRSVIYALAKQQKTFQKVILFDADEFSHTCSLRSTAVVAARGLSLGHSNLGDLLIQAFATFKEHVAVDKPKGIFSITQYSGATTKLDMFKQRYPDAKLQASLGEITLINPMYLAQEEAYLIDTRLYLDWLILQGHSLPLIIENDFVTNINKSSGQFLLSTKDGKAHLVDELIHAGGVANRFFGKASVTAQGSYLEFSDQDFGPQSFSATIDGDNFIYHHHVKKVLIGSTTEAVNHELAPQQMLSDICERLSEILTCDLPAYSEGSIIVGLREKAAKRSPYLIHEAGEHWIGGLYKNGYSLSLHMAQKLISQLP